MQKISHVALLKGLNRVPGQIVHSDVLKPCSARDRYVGFFVIEIARSLVHIHHPPTLKSMV